MPPLIGVPTMQGAAERRVGRFVMGERATRGWVLVAGAVLDDAMLERWIERARAYVSTMPAQ